MYTDWFKLKRLPFRLRPDPEFLYLGGPTGHTYEAVRAAVGSGRGVLALTGEAGVGKTTLLHALAQERQGSMTVARVQQPNLTSAELLAALNEQFGLPPLTPPPAAGSSGHSATTASHPTATVEVKAALRRFVAEEAGHGRAVLILVDEAHRLAGATLSELLNLCGRQPAPLAILVGAPDLSAQIAAQDERAAAALVGTLHLPRLEMEGTEAYIRHRLKVAGAGSRTLFDPDTVAEIQRYTGGTPQLINELCDAAMAQAETHNSPRVGMSEIRGAAQDLKWVEFAARPTSHSAPSAAAKKATPVRAAISAHLEVEQRGKPVKRVTLIPGRLTIGRGEDNGLQLDSQFVSRQHCQIVTTAEQSFVEDLGSTNGILVNGRRRMLHKLQPQDHVVVGDHTLIYLESGDSEASS